MKTYVKNGIWDFPKWVEFFKDDDVRNKNLNAKPIDLKYYELGILNRFDCIKMGMRRISFKRIINELSSKPIDWKIIYILLKKELRYFRYKLIIYHKKKGHIIGIVDWNNYLFYDYNDTMDVIRDPNKEQLLDLKRKVEKIMN